MVPSIAKAVAILDAVGGSPDPLTLSEISRRLDIPKSTASDICATLAERDLLVRHRGGFRLGSHVLDWYRSYTAGIQIPGEFASVCDEMLPDHEETVILSILDDVDSLYLACRPGSHSVAVNYRLGLRLPAHCTSTGKAILSTHTDEEVRSLFANKRLFPRTGHSITDLETLMLDLQQTRARGYAVDDEETSEGMYCFGAPVFAQGATRAAAAVAFGLVKARLDGAKADDLRDGILALAHALSTRLGAATPQGNPVMPESVL